MKAWAICNQKGGVGKTTTTVTLGGLLAAEGRRVLLVDLDPHGSLTSYFGRSPDAMDGSVYTLFERAAGGVHVPLASMLARTRFNGLYLLPASTALVSLDRQFGARDGMGLVLAHAFRQWGQQFDHVLMDCSPTLGMLMVNALAASDRVIVPVQTDFLALKGLERLMHTLAMIERSRGRPFAVTVVPTMYDSRTRAAEEGLQNLHARYPAQLWQGVIPIDTRFRNASRAGIPISHFAPRSARGLQAYAALLESLRMADGEMPAYATAAPRS
ncbi:MAG: Sporulation initiation inhibitor protein Soj [Gammaproteobacteria bacterium]|nr:Sporulation initiation inhibitor protein Soj [Gammaproteobacteria bacterium]